MISFCMIDLEAGQWQREEKNDVKKSLMIDFLKAKQRVYLNHCANFVHNLIIPLIIQLDLLKCVYE